MFIYVIVCSESMKLYVGQHKKENLKRYLDQKYYDAQRFGNKSHLYRAMRKHARETWSIHPLISGIETRPELDEWERLLIYALKAQHPDIGYNICDGGEGFSGPHSESARKKVSIASKKMWAEHPEYRVQMSEISTGREISQKTREKLSAVQLGVPKPEGFGQKISDALMGRTWTPEQRAKIPSAISKAKTGKPSNISPEGEARRKAAALAATKGKPRPAEVLAKWHSPEAQVKSLATRLANAKPVSLEVCQEISERKTAWWKAHPDHKFSKERNQKISATLKGIKRDPGFGDKISLTKFLKTVAWG